MISNEPRRIQLRRTKGWRKPPTAVVVSRPSRWGNPYRVGVATAVYRAAADRADAVALFAALAGASPTFRAMVRAELAGRDLACWCPLPPPGEPDVCHAAVLLEIANGTGPESGLANQ
jgi:uncharacterized protein DUF4326